MNYFCPFTQYHGHLYADAKNESEECSGRDIDDDVSCKTGRVRVVDVYSLCDSAPQVKETEQ